MTHFHDEEAAYEFVEARVWPDERVCPHCGTVDQNGKLKGKSTRIGTYKCYACRKPFTVKIGTIFEASHVKLHIWLQAIFLICASKKGISANQLHRTLGVTLKTAWFIGHRIREAMRGDDLVPFGAGGGLAPPGPSVAAAAMRLLSAMIRALSPDVVFGGDTSRKIALFVVRRHRRGGGNGLEE